MKQLALVLILLTQSAYAEDFCASISATAEKIMIARQSGVMMQELVGALKTIDDPSAKQMFDRIMMAAYETPKYEIPTLRDSTIAEFRNKVYLQCHKSLSR